jgi:hypothetical protein
MINFYYHIIELYDSRITIYKELVGIALGSGSTMLVVGDAVAAPTIFKKIKTKKLFFPTLATCCTTWKPN